MKKAFNIQTCKHLSIIALSFLVICFTACKKSSIPDIITPASINIVNASETSAPQDLYLDDIKANPTPLAYMQASGYINISAGTTHIGEFRTSTTNMVNASFSAIFQPGENYSVYYGDDNTANGTIDDRTPALAGKARVRFLNLNTVSNSALDIAITGGTSVITGLQYKTFSTYYDVTAGSALSLNLSGKYSIQLSIPSTIIQAGHIYTVYISGTTQATVNYHIVTEL